jgi:hypothetical protein
MQKSPYSVPWLFHNILISVPYFFLSAADGVRDSLQDFCFQKDLIQPDRLREFVIKGQNEDKSDIMTRLSSW